MGRRVFGTARCWQDVVVGWLNARQCQVVGGDATMTPYVVTARQSRGEVPERDDWMRRSKCLLHYTALYCTAPEGCGCFAGAVFHVYALIRDYRRRWSFGWSSGGLRLQLSGF